MNKISRENKDKFNNRSYHSIPLNSKKIKVNLKYKRANNAQRLKSSNFKEMIKYSIDINNISSGNDIDPEERKIVTEKLLEIKQRRILGWKLNPKYIRNYNLLEKGIVKLAKIGVYEYGLKNTRKNNAPILVKGRGKLMHNPQVNKSLIRK